MCQSDVRVSLDNKHAHATPSSRPSSSRSPSLLPSQHAHFAACSHVKSASAYQPSLFGASHNTSSSRLLPPRPSSPVPRKRGRPKVGANLPKPVIYGPRPRLGRPPGTGYKQKQQVLGVGPVEPAKRSRGRPKKDVRASAVSIEFGKLVCCFFIFIFIYLTLLTSLSSLSPGHCAQETTMLLHPR